MKFGTVLFSQLQGSALAAIARKAEELGFDSVWLPEHILLPLNYKSVYPYAPSGRIPLPTDTPLHDPLIALAYIAGLTSKIKLATGIFVLPIRNAFTTAKAVASLDVLSGGRFMFGIGVGWLREEFEAVGMNFSDRALRMREYIELMKALWTQSDPVYKGKTVQIEGFKFEPKPVQKPHPPLVFGGHRERSLRRAAELGEGWYGIGVSMEEMREVVAKLRRYEKDYERAKPLEVTVNPRLGELSADQVAELRDMSVDRVIISLGPATRDALAELERVRDQVMAKF